MLFSLLRFFVKLAPVVSKAMDTDHEHAGNRIARASPACAWVMFNAPVDLPRAMQRLHHCATDALFPQDAAQIFEHPARADIACFVPAWRGNRAAWQTFAERVLRADDVSTVICFGSDFDCNEEVVMTFKRDAPPTERVTTLKTTAEVRAALISIPEPLKSRMPYVSVTGPMVELAASFGIDLGPAL